MTPEAVVYKYLEFANARDTAGFVRLLGMDADLLGRWAGLLGCAVEPAAVSAAIDGLQSSVFVDLAHAQGWAGIPASGSARLSMEQWQGVLRAATLGEILAERLQLADPEAVRWRLLLAISGVSVPHDPVLNELLEFRGVGADLLEDAEPLLKVHAVVGALEVTGQEAAAHLAQSLLRIDGAEFENLLDQASARMTQLLADLDLDGDLDDDLAEHLWTRQRISMLATAFCDCRTLEDLYASHRLAARSLFGTAPYLLMLDHQRGALVPLGSQGVGILLDSQSSGIARSVREASRQLLSNAPDQAVADRQVLRRLGVDEGLCFPMIVDNRKVGALVFVIDEDAEGDFSMQAYTDELARWIARRSDESAGELGMLERYRAREEKRVREIVHEANNPLSIVHNYLHILELRLQHEPTVVEQLQMIGNELKRAAGVFQKVRELPPLAATDAGDGAEFADFDVNDLTARVFELHRGYAADHDVEIGMELAGGTVRCRSDEQRLGQILNNLLRNAIEASSGQSVVVGTTAGVFREGREGVEMFVRDTGPGLPRSVLERLGEPKASTKGGDHAGLGLHIVHKLVRELHASIDVRSSAGRGTTFTIFLPADLD